MAKAQITFEGMRAQEIGLNRDVNFPAYLISLTTTYGTYRYNEDFTTLIFIPHDLDRCFPDVYEFSKTETLARMLRNLDLCEKSIDVEIDKDW